MRKSLIIEKLIHIFAYIYMLMAVLFALIACFCVDESQEVSRGSFERISFNDNWMLEINGKTEKISLPYETGAQRGDFLVLKNTLPDTITDGMNLMVKSAMQDVYIYVDGQYRAEYSSEKFLSGIYFLPSTLFATELNKQDAGREIEIRVLVKGRSTLEEVFYSCGNNVWFEPIKSNLWITIATTFVFFMGAIMVLVSIVMRNVPNFTEINSKPSLYLGLLMSDVAIWMFGESGIKPLIFRNPALTQYFTYSAMGLITVFAAMYINEIQHRRHNRAYEIVEAGAIATCALDFALQCFNILELYETIISIHIWMIIALGVTVVVMVRDIITGHVERYKITAVGILCFMLMSFTELAAFYINPNHIFGVYMCVGLVVLMLTTIGQLLNEAHKLAVEKNCQQTAMIVRTVETIASAIDARDKYTGGHSERVSHYAGLIAREMAADYDFTEDDIQRVAYIGLMHDIGKIGVADSVLNKSGKLTDEEYMLMKKHAEIGYELLCSMGENMEGLLDGVKYHHERFDGKGYPEGLSDTDIPLVARILCLADCYDAMTSNRVYRKRLSDEEVMDELKRCSGNQFDPAITDVCLRLIKRGVLKPVTLDGMELDKEGKLRASSILENRLQKDLLAHTGIVADPTHVRMVCYVAKLMEKKGQKVDILMAKYADNTDSADVFKTLIGGRDLHIEYSKSERIVVLFDKTSSEIEKICKTLADAEITVEMIA